MSAAMRPAQFSPAPKSTHLIGQKRFGGLPAVRPAPARRGAGPALPAPGQSPLTGRLFLCAGARLEVRREEADMEGTTPARNPEREAFYQEISPTNLAPLWEVLHGLVTPEPVTPVLPALWKYARGPAPHRARRQDHHRRRGRAPRAGAGKSRPARQILDHPFAVRRHAAHPAGRGRARPSPRRVGAALHPRRARRLYRGRRRAHLHAARRFRHHAELDLPRSRQHHEHADGLARRPRRAAGQSARHVSFQERTAIRDPGGDAPARRFDGAVRRRPDAGGLEAQDPHLAGLHLSVGAHPRRARDHEARAGMGPGPRPQAQIHQPGDRRARDADHRHLHAITAEGVFAPRPIARPTAPSMSASRARA